MVYMSATCPKVRLPLLKTWLQCFKLHKIKLFVEINIHTIYIQVWTSKISTTPAELWSHYCIRSYLTLFSKAYKNPWQPLRGGNMAPSKKMAPEKGLKFVTQVLQGILWGYLKSLSEKNILKFFRGWENRPFLSKSLILVNFWNFWPKEVQHRPKWCILTIQYMETWKIN